MHEFEEQIRELLGGLHGVVIERGPSFLLIRIPEAVCGEVRNRVRRHLGNEVRYFTPVLRELRSQLRQILTDEIIVRFRQEISADVAGKIASAHDVILERPSRYVPNGYIVRVPLALDLRPLDAANDLDKEEGVEFACPQFVSEVRR